MFLILRWLIMIIKINISIREIDFVFFIFEHTHYMNKLFDEFLRNDFKKYNFQIQLVETSFRIFYLDFFQIIIDIIASINFEISSIESFDNENHDFRLSFDTILNKLKFDDFNRCLNRFLVAKHNEQKTCDSIQQRLDKLNNSMNSSDRLQKKEETCEKNVYWLKLVKLFIQLTTTTTR